MAGTEVNMSEIRTLKLHDVPDAEAPDGSRVRPLLGTASGSMAHFELVPGARSRAVAHHTVEEIWFVLSGRGEIWRAHNDTENVSELEPGICFTIARNTRFQFRAGNGTPLRVVAVTMPPWPGSDEAYEVAGIWNATM